MCFKQEQHRNNRVRAKNFWPSTLFVLCVCINIYVYVCMWMGVYDCTKKDESTMRQKSCKAHIPNCIRQREAK